MTKVADAYVEIRADSRKLQSGLSKAVGTTKGAATQMKSSLAGVGRMFGAIGGVAAGAFAFKAMIGGVMSFEDKMTKSLAIVSGLTESTAKRMRAAALEITRATTFSADQAAEAYFFLASAGLNAEQQMASLPVVARFAQAGNFDLALATDLLTDAQSALGLKSADTAKHMENLARVSDVLAKANVLANATMQQFSEALTNRAGAALKVLNKDVEEGVAVLAALADQGVKGVGAGQQLFMALRDLQSAANKNEEAFIAHGIAVYDDAGNVRNMADILGDLEGALEGTTDKQKKAMFAQLGFTDKSQGVMLTLLGTSDAIREYERQLRRAQGTTAEIAKKQLGSLVAQLKLTKNAAMELAISIGTSFLSSLGQVAKGVRLVIYAITDFNEATGGLLSQIAKAAGAVALLLAGLPALVSGIKLVTVAMMGLVAANPVLTALVVGLTAVGTAWNRYGEAVIDAVTKSAFFKKVVVPAFKDAKKVIMGLVRSAQKQFDKWAKSTSKIVKELFGIKVTASQVKQGLAGLVSVSGVLAVVLGLLGLKAALVGVGLTSATIGIVRYSVATAVATVRTVAFSVAQKAVIVTSTIAKAVLLGTAAAVVVFAKGVKLAKIVSLGFVAAKKLLNASLVIGRALWAASTTAIVAFRTVLAATQMWVMATTIAVRALGVALVLKNGILMAVNAAYRGFIAMLASARAAVTLTAVATKALSAAKLLYKGVILGAVAAQKAFNIAMLIGKSATIGSMVAMKAMGVATLTYKGVMAAAAVATHGFTAAVNLAKMAVKGFMRATVVLGLVALAFEGIMYIVDNFGGKISEMWNGVTSGAVTTSTILTNLKALWERLKEAAISLWVTMLPYLQMAWQKMQEFAAWLTTVLVAAWDAIVPAAMHVWQALVNTLSPIISKVIDVLTGLWEWINAAIERNRETWQQWGTYIKDVFYNMVDIAVQVWEGVIGVFSWAMDKLGQMFDWLLSLFGVSTDQMADGFFKAFDSILNWMSLLTTDLGLTWELFKNRVVKIFYVIVDKVTMIFNTLIGVAMGVGGAIAAVFKTSVHNIYVMFQDMAAKVRGTFKGLWAGIKALFSGESFGDAFSSAYDAEVAKVEDDYKNIGDEAGAAFADGMNNHMGPDSPFKEELDQLDEEAANIKGQMEDAREEKRQERDKPEEKPKTELPKFERDESGLAGKIKKPKKPKMKEAPKAEEKEEEAEKKEVKEVSEKKAEFVGITDMSKRLQAALQEKKDTGKEKAEKDIGEMKEVAKDHRDEAKKHGEKLDKIAKKEGVAKFG